MPIRREGNQLEAGPTWADIVERKIQEAIERGLFDDLKGVGQPLIIEENPYEGEWRLAFKILRNAGAAPVWIELSKEIEADMASLEKLASKVRKSTGHLKERLLIELASRVEEINRKIDEFNLVVPMSWLQKAKIRLDVEMPNPPLTGTAENP